jgi:hypothetical protein
MMKKQICIALAIACLAVTLVVLNIEVVNAFAQGTTNQSLEKGGPQAMLKKAHSSTMAAAPQKKFVVVMIVCPANFTSIENQCDVFPIH